MTKEEKFWKEYQEEKKRIIGGQVVPKNESPDAKKKRIAEMLDDPTGLAFCNYYFKHYMSSPFGWFHKKAIKAVLADPKIYLGAEWPRGHAKSILFDVIIPLLLMAKGLLDGMIVASNNEDKAIMLLADIKAELEFNDRFINDFGKKKTFGNWGDSSFSADGIGFWAYGRGQSPRGSREGAKRPNYIVCDDLDDKALCKNKKLVKEAKEWVLEDLMGCFDPKNGGRFIVAGNRIHKFSTLAYLMGDVEEEQPVFDHITHIKVFALENPKTHKMDQSEKGVPAWKERLTRADVLDRMKKMGYNASQREYFHIHIQEGEKWKSEWFIWADLPNLSAYKYIITYCDPSYKDTAKNDYKAIIAVGRLGKYYDVLGAFVDQCSLTDMVVAHYDMAEELQRNGALLVYHFLETNFIQDMHLTEYVNESIKRGYMLPIQGDARKKPDKKGRIENCTPLWQRGLVRFWKKLRKSRHMQNFIDQLLAFPAGHDDAPDAFEGGKTIADEMNRVSEPEEEPQGKRRRTADNRL
jgi:predicted phage terminase large subunit-like protein